MGQRLQRFNEWADDLVVNGVSSSSFPLLRASWNQPGQWVRGVFYKATTVNLVFMAIGAWLLIAGIVLANSEVRDGSVSCGTVFAPTESFTPEGEELADLLGYTYTGPDNDPGQVLQCAYALSDQEGRVFSRVLPGGAMFLIAGLIAFGRNPDEGPWAPLRRNARKLGDENLATSAVEGLRPGWYLDQADPALIRWFDGRRWTSATLPKGADGPTDSAHQAPDIDR